MEAGIESSDKPVPKVVAVHLQDGPALLARWRSRPGAADEMFVPEALEQQVGDPVVLDIYFDHSGYAFRVLGKVISRRLTRSDELPSGARVALDVEDEAPLRQMILAHARGQDIEYRPRTGVRVLCRFPVRVQAPAPARGEVIDLSPGGARVVGVSPPPLGALLSLKLHPPGSLLGIAVEGRVVWERPEPDPAMGVEFRFERARVRRRIEELVERLAESGRASA